MIAAKFNPKTASLAVMALAALVLLSSFAFSQARRTRYAAERNEAQESLQMYVLQMLNKENVARFNFKSLDEARSATVGDPYSVSYIALDALQEYRAGTTARSIMKDAKKLWFPVLVGGEVRTKIEMVQRDGKWIGGEFGGTKSVQIISRVEQQLPGLFESEGLTEPFDTKMVMLPALYAVFFYEEDERGEYMVAAMAQPKRFGLRNGQIYEAEELLMRLKEHAVKIDPKKTM